jgi:hypothetical protein
MRNDLQELRKQAEKAVRDMPEGDLKVKAFETILAHLLSGNARRAAEPSDRKSKVAPKNGESAPTTPKSLGDRVLLLKAEGFFISQRSIAEIRDELKTNGWHYPVTSMSGPLQSLVQNRKLRREKVANGEGRKGWKYSNP